MLFVTAFHLVGLYLALALGFLVLLSDPRSRLNQLFAVFCLLISFESLVSAMIITAESPARAMRWHDLLLVWPLTVSLLAHVVLHILELERRPFGKVALVLVYATFPLYLWAFLSHEVRVQMTQTPWGFSSRVDPSPLSIRVLTLWSGVLTLLTGVGGIVGVARAKGRLAKRRAALLAAGTIMPLLAGATCHAVLPRLGLVIPDLTLGGFVVGAALLGYGIRRHGLLTITPELAAQRIVEVMADGVFLLDADGRIARSNPAAAHLVALEEGALVGRCFSDFCPDFASPGSDSAWAMRSGCSMIETELRHDAGTVPVALAIAPIRGRTTLLGGVLVLARDVSATRAAMSAAMGARDEAERMSRAKSDFLANLSHEIRTPMNGVIGLAELLLDGELRPDQRDLLETMRASSASLMLLIDEVLDFSKIEAGKTRIDSHPLELRRIAAEVVQLFTARSTMEVVWSFEVDPSVPQILFGDPLRIRQVLTNLVGNAAKFTERGQITVRLRAVGARPRGLVVRIEVEDTGIGIAAEHLSTVFDPFVQVDASTTRRRGGTGLGLAIVRHLVELMGGHVGVHSKVGQGSVFWLELPLSETSGDDEDSGEETDSLLIRRSALEAASRGTATKQLGSLLSKSYERPPRCLVVEDNPTNAKVARLLLERLGCKAACVEGGAEALTLLAKEDFDIVFMDCQMPQMDGFEATARIRAPRGPARNPRIPIVALTALAASEDSARCLAAGMDGYLPKPVAPRDLAEALTRYLPHLSKK